MHDTRHSYTCGQIGVRVVAYRLKLMRDGNGEAGDRVLMKYSREKIVTVGPGCEVISWRAVEETKRIGKSRPASHCSLRRTLSCRRIPPRWCGPVTGPLQCLHPLHFVAKNCSVCVMGLGGTKERLFSSASPTFDSSTCCAEVPNSGGSLQCAMSLRNDDRSVSFLDSVGAAGRVRGEPQRWGCSPSV